MSEKVLNGVDLAALGEILETIQKEPQMADFEFRSSTDWKKGAIAESSFTGHKQNGIDVSREVPHKLGADEPVALLGSGTEIGPAGHLLHAMSHCLAVTIAYHGAARDVELNSLRVEAEGTRDLQGFFGLNEKVKPGFKHIHLTVDIASPNSSDQVYALFQFVQGRSPICSTVREPVHVIWEYEVENTDASPETGEYRHGINHTDLLETIAAVKETPVLAKCKFYSTTRWKGGARVETTNPGFDQAEGELLVKHRVNPPMGYLGDELVQLLGDDAGPSPSETLLHAMASCVSVTTSYHAAARGIPLEGLKVDLAGDMDLQGFADLDDRVTPAYQYIRAKVKVKAGGKQEELKGFMSYATSHSPICDTVSRPTHVTFSLKHNGRAAEAPVEG